MGTPAFFTTKLEPLKFPGSMGSLNVTVMADVVGMPEALLAGAVETTAGGWISQVVKEADTLVSMVFPAASSTLPDTVRV